MVLYGAWAPQLLSRAASVPQLMSRAADVACRS